MSFEPIESTRPCTKGSRVSVALRRRNDGGAPRVFVSIDLGLIADLGWEKSGHVTAHFGTGQDNGWLRLAPVTAGLGGTALKIQTKGMNSARVGLKIDPWFDYRGVRLSARPAEYRVKNPNGFLDIELPAELAALPTVRLVG